MPNPNFVGNQCYIGSTILIDLINSFQILYKNKVNVVVIFYIVKL